MKMLTRAQIEYVQDRTLVLAVSRLTRAALAGSCLLLAAAGCKDNRIIGSGILKTEVRVHEAFDKVQFDGAGEVHIEIGEPPLVEISADDNLLALITTKVADGKLTIYPSRPMLPKAGVKVRITTGALTSLAMLGAGDARASGIKGESLELKVTGAAKVFATGQVGHLKATVTGAGDLMLDGLTASAAQIILTGGSNAEVHVIDKLDVTITGAAKVQYRGQPQVTQKVTGAGTLVQKKE